MLARLRLEQRRRRRADTQDRLRALVDHAARRSPLLRQRLAGLEGAPLDELPVLTKDDLVDRFDELVTDPALRRADLEALVRSPAGGGRHLGRYRVAVSSGSTGRPAIIAFDPREWAGLLAASASQRRLAGATGGRSAKVGSPSPWHLSAQVGATLADPRRPTLRLPVTTPLPELVAALDRFAPEVLTAYPSVLALLAGPLLTRPQRVFAGGEVLTAATRRAVADAWGTEPLDQYMTTEAGPVAGECEAGAGMHVLDDHVIVEVVDEHRRAVAPGVFGASVLVTALSSRTVPLLRYELADRACLAVGGCPCGRPGPRIAGIAGRAREVLRLGGVAVHPTVLTPVLDTAPVSGWQVVQHGDRLRVLVVGPRDDFDGGALASGVHSSLAELGVRSVAVDVEPVASIPRDGGGKASLFVVER